MAYLDAKGCDTDCGPYAIHGTVVAVGARTDRMISRA